jgi:hypothetical protein
MLKSKYITKNKECHCRAEVFKASLTRLQVALAPTCQNTQNIIVSSCTLQLLFLVKGSVAAVLVPYNSFFF